MLKGEVELFSYATAATNEHFTWRSPYWLGWNPAFLQHVSQSIQILKYDTQLFYHRKVIHRVAGYRSSKHKRLVLLAASSSKTKSSDGIRGPFRISTACMLGSLNGEN